VDNEVLVEAKDDAYVRVGDFAQVKIDRAEEFDLFGTFVK
jgi:ribosomal protein S12 methylthiotransferase